MAKAITAMTKWTAGLLFGARLRKIFRKQEKGWDFCPSPYFLRLVKVKDYKIISFSKE